MTEHDTTNEPGDVDIVEAAQNLQQSFEEMSDLTAQLSGSMTEVADGFESMSKSTGSLETRSQARIDATRSGHVAADD